MSNPTAAEQEATPIATPVSVALEPLGVTIVADVDEFSDGNKCSCAAGDDNPF